MAVEELKKESNPDVIEEKARFIYEDYISILSPKEVSVHISVFLEVYVYLVNCYNIRTEKSYYLLYLHYLHYLHQLEIYCTTMIPWFILFYV